MSDKQTTVLTYGTFDLFHYGHLRLLQRAKELGDRLVVGVVSDYLCQIKGKAPTIPASERIEIIKALKCVDIVFEQTELEQKEKDIERFGVNFLVVGDDWKDHPRFEKVRGYQGVQIVYLERTPDVSSSDIKQKILNGIDR